MGASETEKPNWLKVKPADLEKLIIDIVKENKNPAQIGNILRDQHGIPKSKLVGQKITKIIKNHKLSFRTEKEIAKEKVEGLNAHISKHKHDKKAKRSLIKHVWVVHKFEKAAQ